MIELLVWFIGSFISTIGVINLFSKLNEIEFKFDFVNFGLLIIGSLALSLTKFFNLTFLSFTIYFLFYPIFYYRLSKFTAKKLLYYVVIVWLYGVILDFVVMTVVSIIHYFFNFDIYNYYYECLFTVCSFCLIILLSYSKKLKNFTNNLYVKILKMRYINVALMFFSLFIFLMGVVIFLNMKSINVNLLLVLLVFMILVVLIFLIKLKINEEENIIFLKNLKENNDFYIKVDDENRIFKHNLNAKLMSIKSVSNDESQALINDLVNEVTVKSRNTKKIKFIPYGLNGIIYEKIYSYLEELNVEVDNTIDYDIFKVLKPRRYNVLIEKIIIVLDNAIEASLNSDAKVLLLNIHDYNDAIVVEIINSFASNININELGVINYSTKGKKRGLGLFSALRNGEATLSIKIKNDLFLSKIVVKKNFADLD